MTTAEERMKVLKMIQDGKISTDEGAKLLKALSAKSEKPRRAKTLSSTEGLLRVRVTDMKSGKTKVNVNLPLRLVDAGLNIAARFTPDMEMDELGGAITEAIAENMVGKIVDVVDEEDGEHVEVFIE